ncbi:AIR synthase related protein [Hoeflea sp. TYP-13]|uniref:AIR synthase related protein n=1 Tax=Hoeflea sp. TYP-13 TaxID=3230023 RepID=UPI0034C63270
MSNTTEKSNAFLDAVVSAVRNHTGVSGKQAINGASRFVDPVDPVHGPGDDGAIVDIASHQVVACGEAISPPFIEGDPYGAGIAGVLANVNDVAAMGGIPRGIVNTVVGPTRVTSELMRGLSDAAEMYDVPILGGHLTEREGESSLSAFAIGHAEQVLSMANVRPGQALLFACSLDGEMRPDFPFFTSIERQGPNLARDVRLLAQVAAEGAAVAAKDVSMAGSLGSLAMLLEFTRCGANVDLRRHPMPADTDPLRWLVSFPTYAFWLTADPDRVADCAGIFESKGLICAQVGEVTGGGALVLEDGDHRRTLIDLSSESVTGLWN